MRIASFPTMASRRLARALATALALVALTSLAGCGKSPASAATDADTATRSTPGVTAPEDTADPAKAASPHAADASLATRSGELTNPDDATMVYLYYDLAGITPPIDQWVQNDSRVQMARGADKATQRATVKATFNAGMAAVRGVGVIHLTTRASLSQYDPTYGEFTIGALSPASVFTFRALNQTVTLKFDNGLAAQSWSVPKDEAQAIMDKVGNDPLSVDTTLKIDKVLPDPAGGSIVARIVSWNMRNTRDGTTIARVQVPEDK